MKLLELFEKVKEEHLSKEQLEDYHKTLTDLYVQIILEKAKLEKEQGMFMGRNPEIPTASKNREWKVTESGQRLIDIKAYERSAKQVLNSLKTRIYSLL